MLTVDLDKLALTPGAVCVDVGCGEGRHTLATYLIDGVEALGIDLCEQDLGTATQRIQDMTPHAPGGDIGLPPGTPPACHWLTRVSTR